MSTVTPEIKNYLDRLKLGFVATVSPDGLPNVSPRGTIISWGTDCLVFADIKSPQTTSNIDSNPAVEISIVDPMIRKGFCFQGTAIILRHGDEFDKIIQHYKSIGVQSKIKAAIKVKLTGIERIVSPLYDLGLTEDKIRAKFHQS